MRKIPKEYVMSLLAVTILGGAFLYTKQTKSVEIHAASLQTKEDAKVVEELWKKEITFNGGKIAYAALKLAYATSSAGVQHTAAHVFGAALYAAEGLRALSVCDNSFSYGCFHEFLGRAIEERGLSVVSELNRGCFDALGPGVGLACTHGLGHGIQAYLGYNYEALVQALAQCDILTNGDPIGGCAGGVYMEYNMRTMRSFAGMGIRKFTSGREMEPCDTLEKKHVAACLYWQPQWWNQILLSDGYTPEESYAQMGKWCEVTSTVELRKRCFNGIGNIVVSSADFKTAGVISLCSHSHASEMYKTYCLATAASHFFSTPGLKEAAEDVCSGLSGAHLTYCSFYALGKMNGKEPAPEL